MAQLRRPGFHTRPFVVLVAGLNRTSPVQASDLAGGAAIAGRWGHSLARLNNEGEWAWGDNWYGQLGDGTTTDRSAPVQASGLAGDVEITGGWGHSLARRNDKVVWAWGDNWYGPGGRGDDDRPHCPGVGRFERQRLT